MAEDFEVGRVYGPNDGLHSSIGAQLIPFYHYKNSIIDLKKYQFFGQLADTITMP